MFNQIKKKYFNEIINEIQKSGLYFAVKNLNTEFIKLLLTLPKIEVNNGIQFPF